MESTLLYPKSESQENLLENGDLDKLDGPGPPSLKYSLRDRKVAIAITWTVILIDSCIMPVGLFYSLWFGSNLSHERSKPLLCSVLLSIEDVDVSLAEQYSQ